MSFSQRNIIASEILSDDPLSEGTLAYLEARAKNAFYDFILTKFKKAEQSGLTKAKLARRLGKKPDQISHILGAPGNWTLGTIAGLLVGINNEELLPHSASFLGRPPSNRWSRDILNDEEIGWHQPQTTSTPAPTTFVAPQWNRPQ